MTEQHLSLDALADLLAAEGSDADVAHVGSCAGCSGRLDELATAQLEVAAVLGSLPAPPVPEGLAGRLQAAFDAEPALVPEPTAAAGVTAGGPADATEPEERPRTAGATVTPFPDAAERRRRSWLPAAAGLALVIGGGALGAALLLPTSGDDESLTSATGGAAGDSAGTDYADLPRSETGTDYAADGRLAAALPSLLSGSAGALTAPLAESGGDAGGPAPAAAPVPAPDPALESSSRSAEAPSASLDTAAAPGLERLRTPEGLASCLSALLPPEDDTVRPLAVDYAAYAGEPALVVLLPANDAPEAVDVFVVGAGCTQGDDRTLFFTRLARP